ncbi:MAG: tyrosine-type recombinase/integrase [Nitrososphaeraceae archaeon]
MPFEHQEQIYGADAAIPSPFTRTVYRCTFNAFLRYLDMEDRQADLLQQDRKVIESQIIGYIRYLSETRHYNRYSLGTPLASIFHFYEMNDIIINKRKITRFIPQDDSSMNSESVAINKDRAYTHEEISQIIQSTDPRGKVIIMLMASSGMRMGAISGLLTGHLTKIPQYNLYRIIVYASSRKSRYYTFCTPECAAIIDAYLAFRSRFGDPLKPTSPLIREQFDINDPFAGFHAKPVKHRSIEFIVNTIIKRSGIKTKEVARSHGLRKFAITQMIKAKLDYSAREYMVGHKVSRGLDINYDRTTEEDRLQEYLKAVDLLTINLENRLKRKIYQLESQHSDEWNALKAQMDELKAVLDRTSSKE